jgi:hypothetical protein
MSTAFDFKPLIGEATAKHLQYRFLSERYLPLLTALLEHARSHRDDANARGDGTEQACEEILREVGKMHGDALIEMSDLSGQIYGHEPGRIA